MTINAVVYDIEIINAIPDKKSLPVEGITYCAGWGDHTNMGISVIGAYDYITERYRVFCADNFDEFRKLCGERKCLVTFNGLSFDNKVICAYLGAKFEETENDYDLLAEMWVAAGLARAFAYPTHVGFSLDATAKANLDAVKTGTGALAPIDWQRGKIGSVIDYCLNDVKLTKGLFDAVLRGYVLRDPRNPGKFLTMRKPIIA
jgi:hypothetical protein